MEDLFAQKDVGLCFPLLRETVFGFTVVFVCKDGGGRAAQLDREVPSASPVLWSSVSPAVAHSSGVTGDEETESV